MSPGYRLRQQPRAVVEGRGVGRGGDLQVVAGAGEVLGHGDPIRRQQIAGGFDRVVFVQRGREGYEGVRSRDGEGGDFESAGRVGGGGTREKILKVRENITITIPGRATWA